MNRRPRVAVAGAGGFIGTALCPALARDYEVLALTRSAARAATPDPSGRIAWRLTDLFCDRDVTAALAGIDYCVHLVHSLAPSSRLTQAHARDLDLILADNLARAAAANGVARIVMVSSVMPQGFRIAPFLWSRREVEMALAERGVPVAALRASLVVGPGGTGAQLLVDLVRRLPLIPLPRAARSLTRPIAVADLVRAILHVLERPEPLTGAFDIGGPDCLSYADMLRQTAAALGLRRRFVQVPGLPLWLAAEAARLASGAPAPVVGTIVESLPQDTIMADNPLQAAIAPGASGFREALAASLDPATRRLLPSPRQPLRAPDRALHRSRSLVRSIQRVILPPGQDAAWVAGNYFRWLGECCGPFVRTRIDTAGSVEVFLGPSRVKLLALTRLAEESTREREVYAIAGGLLARIEGSGRPRFEFRTVLAGRYTLTAIHDYAPTLPWPVYILTQALAHLFVMRRYRARLAR